MYLKLTCRYSGNDDLDPGVKSPAGPSHGVPVEGPHHLLNLLGQVLGFVVRRCIDL